MMPIFRVAAYDEPYPVEGGRIYFDIYTGEITGCDKNVTVANIPEYIDGIKIVGIAPVAFTEAERLRSVTIPNTVITIGNSAFSHCKNLESITLPNRLTSIGKQAFSSCYALENIVIPGSLSVISEGAFSFCKNLTSVTIQDGVTTIGEDAFMGCQSLTDVAIADSVINVGPYAFAYCESLCSIELPRNLPEISESMFYSCKSLERITIPGSVSKIGNSAFFDCDSLTNLTLSEGMESIGEYAFHVCDGLTSLTLPSSLRTIHDNAFSFCQSLKRVVIPDGVIAIGASAFEFCLKLDSATISASVQSIGDCAFSGCLELDNITVLNPQCDIYHTEFTLGLSSYAVIHGYIDSTAHAYAKAFGYKFSCLIHAPMSGLGIAPTCLTEGLSDGSYCSVCNEILIPQEPIAALGHDWDSGNITTAPTCTTVGAKTFTCSNCGETKTEELPALGHNYEAIVTEPTCTQDGYTTYTCPACGDSYTADIVEAIGHSFFGGYCLDCGAEDPDYLPKNPFEDLSPSDYFYKPVLWALKYEITNGVSATQFGPNDSCTRAQIVTFLWRSLSCPEPNSSKNPFTDIEEDSYYYRAVLWAVERGITNGISATEFAPDATCTRAQAVTFLHRTLNKPNVSHSNNPFTDVTKTAYYYDAVLWAVERGITNGVTSTEFAPDQTCTRAQIVTFLYRTFK